MLGMSQKEKAPSLSYALRNYDWDDARKIIKRADPNRPSSEGVLPLFEAATLGNESRAEEFAGLLLKRGADVNKVNTRGATALHYVLSQRPKYTSVVRALLKAGASVDVES